MTQTPAQQRNNRRVRVRRERQEIAELKERNEVLQDAINKLQGTINAKNAKIGEQEMELEQLKAYAETLEQRLGGVK